jgi:hypothetical protein
MVLWGSCSRMCSRGVYDFSAYGLGVLLLAGLFARLRLEMEEVTYNQHIKNMYMIITDHGLRTCSGVLCKMSIKSENIKNKISDLCERERERMFLSICI